MTDARRRHAELEGDQARLRRQLVDLPLDAVRRRVRRLEHENRCAGDDLPAARVQGHRADRLAGHRAPAGGQGRIEDHRVADHEPAQTRGAAGTDRRRARRSRPCAARWSRPSTRSRATSPNRSGRACGTRCPRRRAEPIQDRIQAQAPRVTENMLNEMKVGPEPLRRSPVPRRHHAGAQQGQAGQADAQRERRRDGVRPAQRNLFRLGHRPGADGRVGTVPESVDHARLRFRCRFH